MANFVWTPEMNDLLVQLIDVEGLSSAQIAQRINAQFRDVLGDYQITRNAVIGRRHRIAKNGGKPLVERAVSNQPRQRTKRATPSLARKAELRFKPQPKAEIIPKPSLDQACTLDLATGCRFGVNNPAPGEPHLFCNHAQKPGSSYCEYHHHVCYTPAKSQRIRPPWAQPRRLVA